MDIFWQSCGCFQDCRQYNHIFTIRKLDSVTGAPIAGAEFTLTPLCGIGTRVGTTDANGRLTFCVTPCTGYELRESATPSGYTPNTDLHTVCVGANGCVTVDGVAVCIYDIFNIPLSAFSVTYLPNGGTGTFTDSDLVAGSLYTIKSAAETGITRPGYTFVSWNTAPDGTGTTYVPGDVIHITGDLTLYAQWVAEMTFSVVYGPNGGTGGHTDSGLAAGASYTIRSAAEANVSRAGYSFASWNTASDGTGTTYLPGEMITITGDLVLYAQWTPDLFSLIYDPNGGTGGHTDSGLAAGASYTILSAAEADVSRAGFVFTSWNTSPDGTGTTYLPGDVIPITGDLTLYAQWTVEATFFVAYDPNGGTGGHIDSGLAAGASYTVLTAEEADVSRTGFIFTSWNTSPDGTGTTYLPGNVIDITGDLMLYAQWTPELFSVIYDPNEGTGGRTDSDLAAGASYTVLTAEEADVSRTGFVFTSWNTAPDGSGTTYLPGEVITITGDLTLYAQWAMEVIYTVIYDANGGTGGHTDDLALGTVYTILDEAQTGVFLPSSVLVSWNTSADGSGTTYLPGEQITIERSLVLYAQWESLV